MFALLLALLSVPESAAAEGLPVVLALDNGGFLQEFYWPQRGPRRNGEWLPRASVMQDFAVSVSAASPAGFEVWVAQPPGIGEPQGPCRVEAAESDLATASAWTGLDANYHGTTSTSLIALHRALSSGDVPCHSSGEQGAPAETEDAPRIEVYVFDLLEEDDRDAFDADEREACIRPERLAESVSEVLVDRPDHLWLGQAAADPGPFVPNPALAPWDANAVRQGKAPRSDAPRRYVFEAASCGTGLSAKNFYDDVEARPLGVLIVGRGTARRDAEVQAFVADLDALFATKTALDLDLVQVRRQVEYVQDADGLQLAGTSPQLVVPLPEVPAPHTAEECSEPLLRFEANWSPSEERPYPVPAQDAACEGELLVSLGDESARQREFLRQMGVLTPYWWYEEAMEREALEPCTGKWCLHLNAQVFVDSPARSTLGDDLQRLGDFSGWEAGPDTPRVSDAWVELVARLTDDDFANTWALTHTVDRLRVEHPEDPRPYEAAIGLGLVAWVSFIIWAWTRWLRPHLRRSADWEAARIDAGGRAMSLHAFYLALDDALAPIEDRLRWRYAALGGGVGFGVGAALAWAILAAFYAVST